MIAVPAGVKVLVATKPVDFHRGADGHAALAREQLQHDPFWDDLYLPLEAGPITDILHIVFVLRRSPIVGIRCLGGCCRFHRFGAARN
jgi:hypothetical protein